MANLNRFIAGTLLAVMLALHLWQTISDNVLGTTYPADRGMSNTEFWADRLGVTATVGREVIPIQLPGPLDERWAGPGPKWFRLPPPPSSQRMLELQFLESHESAPPTLEVSVGGRVVERLKLRAGNGSRWNEWRKKGVRQRIVIDLSDYSDGEGDVLVRNVAGSWTALSEARYFSNKRLWVQIVIALLLLIGIIAALGKKIPFNKPANFLKYTLFWLTALMVSLSFGLAFAELGLRIVFQDGGKTTSQGPGNKGFAYDMADGNNRFPQAKGPKLDGVTRLLIQGDSVTLGFGVRDWRKIWPPRLISLLGSQKHEMATIIHPNRELDFHRDLLYQRVNAIDPDMVLLQMYVNDIELEKCHHNTCGRPYPTGLWWRSSLHHSWLLNNSYLYYFLDNRLGSIWPNRNRSYPAYLVEDFSEGTKKGQYWRTEFYRYVTVAARNGRRVIVMFYPMAPYGKRNPLKPLIEQIDRMQGEGIFTIYAHATQRETGQDVFNGTSDRPGMTRRARKGVDKPGLLVNGPELPVDQGNHRVRFLIRGHGEKENYAATLLVVDSRGKEYAKQQIDGAEIQESWQWFELSFVVERSDVRDLRFIVDFTGTADLEVDRIEFPVNLSFEFIDLSEPLNRIDSHASPFDWHPNANAHDLISRILFKHLKSLP